MEQLMKFCPQCKSTDIVEYAGGTVGMWQCKQCKFVNALFPEKIVDGKKPVKKTKPKNNG